MKSKRIVLVGLLVAIGVAAWVMTNWSRTDRAPGEPASTADVASSSNQIIVENLPSTGNVTRAWTPPNKVEYITDLLRRQRKATDEWRAPIDFYGKVVDETGEPVADAKVVFGLNNLNGHSTIETASDPVGFFDLRNRRGKHLSMRVSKEGYYTSAHNPRGFFYAGRNNNFVPDPNSPVVFRLRKKGEAEPLITFENDVLIRRDGTPVYVSLTTGKPVPEGRGDVMVECWTDDQGKARGETYDWRCRISVPGGGLQASTNEFEFLAPLEGYSLQDEINMPADMEAGWGRSAERKYLLRLGNGNYARIKFKMIAGGGHFFYLQSFMNPSGSRNLEYDKAVQPRPLVYE